MITVAILGLGNRGRIYENVLSKNKDVKIVAICDINKNMLDKYGTKHNIDAKYRFTSADAFFDAGKLADMLIIATQDQDHYPQSKKAIALNYHILLEKPLSPNLDECYDLERDAKEHNVYISTCYVLRYVKFYDKIKSVIDSGKIGKIININHTENIGYWHFSHSYVRGNWRREEDASPSILAKCCHDFDILCYFVGSKIKSLDSYGSQNVFSAKNAPSDAPNYCLQNCPHLKTCPYSVPNIYYRVTLHSLPKMIKNKTLITGNPDSSIKEFKEVLKTSPYGKCVYHCDNNVNETQVVSMQFENGATATLTATAFSKQYFRHIHIYGEKGEIIGNDTDGFFTISYFGGKKQLVICSLPGIAHRMGANEKLVNEFVDLIDKQRMSTKIPLISSAVESHRIALLSHQKSQKN